MDKKYTLRDIAAEAGVSLSTVHRALNNTGYVAADKKKEILDIAASHGYSSLKYQYASDMSATGSRRNIFLINTPSLIPVMLDPVSLTDEYIMQNVSSNNCNTIVHTISSDELNTQSLMKIIKDSMDYKPIGIIIHAPLTQPSTPEFDDFIDAISIPIVNLGQSHISYNFYKILIDNTKGMYEATKYLIRSGCRNLLFIGSSKVYGGDTSLEREEGFLSAINEYSSVKVHSKTYDFSPEIGNDGKFDFSSSYSILEQMFSEMPNIDGILNWSDALLPGELRYLNEHHKTVSKDVKVVGFSNLVTPYFQPGIIGVDIPYEEITKTAVKYIIDHSDTNYQQVAQELRFLPTLHLKNQ